MKRVVILQSWSFHVKWEEIFQPITNCTLKDISDPSSNFGQGMDKIEVVNDSVIFADIRINLYHLHLLQDLHQRYWKRIPTRQPFGSGNLCII